MKHSFRFVLLGGAFALIILGIAITSSAQGETSQLRLGHFVFGAPSVNLYIDGNVVLGEDEVPSIFASMALPSRYLNLAADAHTFAISAEGDTLESALISEQEFTLEADHVYTLAVLGNLVADDLQFALIDETMAIEQFDISLSAVTIVINNMYGVPALDGFLGDIPTVTDLAYGDYFVGQDPTEGMGSLVTMHGEPDSVIFEYGDAVGSPGNYFAYFVFSGEFPGEMGEDYLPYYSGQYVGGLTIIDGGIITVGDSIPVDITDMGQRVQFTLVLDEAMTLDIVEAAVNVETGADAHLRIYNAVGDMLFENEELSMDDNDQGNFDAGWLNLELAAGNYTLEAGSFIDTSTGSFILSVSPSQ